MCNYLTFFFLIRIRFIIKLISSLLSGRRVSTPKPLTLPVRKKKKKQHDSSCVVFLIWLSTGNNNNFYMRTSARRIRTKNDFRFTWLNADPTLSRGFSRPEMFTTRFRLRFWLTRRCFFPRRCVVVFTRDFTVARDTMWSIKSVFFFSTSYPRQY